MSRFKPQLDKPKDGFGPCRFVALFSCPGVHTFTQFGRKTDGRYGIIFVSAAICFLFFSPSCKDGNPWDVSFTTMFHMSNDSGHFRTAAQLAEAGFVREGIDWVLPTGAAPRQGVLAFAGSRDDRSLPLEDGALSGGGERYVPLYDADPTFEAIPFYFVCQSDVRERLPSNWNRLWLLAFKDVTASTNERTTIFSLIPLSGVGHTAPLVFPSAAERPAAALLACFNSLVVDYCARTKVGGLHLTYFYLKQFPILPPSAYTDVGLSFIVPRVLELTYTSHSMAPFARDLGYDDPPFSWNEDRRAQLRAELDAFYARAYGLTRDELHYILDPADVKGADYPSETFRVLKNNEISRFGEYRTARLVLQAWDRLERGGLAA